MVARRRPSAWPPGSFGGCVDTVLARLIDVVLSVPFLLVAIALVSVFSPSLTITILVIGFFSWASVARIVRGQVLSLREREFVEAARSLGAGDSRIMFVDILPNVLAPVIVYTTLLIPVVIVTQATLSFLGLGLQPPTADWGGMISARRASTSRPGGSLLPQPGPADHHAGLQPVRRRRPRRVRPAHRPATCRSDGATVLITFLIRRIISGLLVLWIISMLVFALFFAVPNNVARTLAGHNATPETIALIEQRLGSGRPDLGSST